MRQVVAHIEDRDFDDLETLVQQGRFKNRSAAIRDAIEYLIERTEVRVPKHEPRIQNVKNLTKKFVRTYSNPDEQPHLRFIWENAQFLNAIKCNARGWGFEVTAHKLAAASDRTPAAATRFLKKLEHHGFLRALGKRRAANLWEFIDSDLFLINTKLEAQ